MSRKQCSSCLKNKDFKNFSSKKDGKHGIKAVCKDCSNKKYREYYYSNNSKLRDQINTARRARTLKIKQFVFDLLKKYGCIDCGENNPVVLEFDHIKDKHSDVSLLIRNGCSLSKITAEISKCQIRCANCHRIKTASDQNWYKNLK